jgi:hypothetical protein
MLCHALKAALINPLISQEPLNNNDKKGDQK